MQASTLPPTFGAGLFLKNKLSLKPGCHNSPVCKTQNGGRAKINHFQFLNNHIMSAFNTTNFQTTTHAIGGGEWSIEVHDDEGNYIREFVGLNGTGDNEEADDLWSEYNAWVDSLPDNPDLLYCVSCERSRRSDKVRYVPVVSIIGTMSYLQAHDECVRLNQL